MKKITVTCLVALAPLVSSYGQNLITNPEFQDTNSDTNFGDSWGSFGAAGFNDFFSSNGHASFFADNSGNAGGVFQTGIGATPGLEYTFDLTDFLVEDNFGGTLNVALEFYEGDDSTQISSEATTLNLALSDPAPAAGTLTVTATAPAGTAFARPLISFSNADGSAATSENFFVFNTSLTAIPEPSVAALGLGLVGLGLVTVRRRRRT